MSVPEIFVAVRCDQLAAPVFGSRIVLCERCQYRMWIAPSGIEIVRAKGMEVLCQRDAMMLNDGLAAVVPFTPEQLYEVATSLGRNN